MSDDHEFEDEQPDQPKDPVRAHLRKLEAENKALREQAAAAELAKRELTFVKAGINPDDPRAKYFVKGYDGELSVEAIRSAAEEASLLTPNRVNDSEKQAFNRIARTTAAGETSEPVVDYAAKIKGARSQAEVMQILAQARAEAETL
jgi:hypothetical protein